MLVLPAQLQIVESNGTRVWTKRKGKTCVYWTRTFLTNKASSSCLSDVGKKVGDAITGMGGS